MESINPITSDTQPEPEISRPNRGSDDAKSVLSTISIIISAVVFALLLTAFVFQSYEVDGQSMQSTLQNRDRLIVAKLPKTWARLTGHDYIPNRGDVIVFNTTAVRDGAADTGTKQLIKRVIGLPGERVVVKDDVITVYNNEFPEGFNPDKTGGWGDVIHGTSGNVDLVVGKGEVFVCGDNRSNSYDSRELGAIPSKDIVGKLLLRIYPLSTAEVF